MKRKKNLIVSLCGGLGNQLFQISNALALTQDTIVLESNLGLPRRNSLGEPEILSFTLPERIQFREFNPPGSFFTRTASYLLRSRSNPTLLEGLKFYRCTVTLLCTLILSTYFKKIVLIVNSSGIGIKAFKKSPRKNLQIGYFQSYLSSEVNEVFFAMKGITPVDISKYANELLNEVAQKKILVVHLRLGDYKNEDNFGLPGHLYYVDAINRATANELFTDIWIFSDEILLAKKKLSISTELPIRWIGDKELSTAETFAIMKQGKGFVIANSSFSWWAARLSNTVNPFVAAPDPWFKNLAEPDNLIPPEWLRLNAHYE